VIKSKNAACLSCLLEEKLPKAMVFERQKNPEIFRVSYREHFSKYCSLQKNIFRKRNSYPFALNPERDEGPHYRSWFDKLTTNGNALYEKYGYKIKKCSRI
jgi:hypothetical protein